jgi:hypothetical protein
MKKWMDARGRAAAEADSGQPASRAPHLRQAFHLKPLHAEPDVSLFRFPVVVFGIVLRVFRLTELHAAFSDKPFQAAVVSIFFSHGNLNIATITGPCHLPPTLSAKGPLPFAAGPAGLRFRQWIHNGIDLLENIVA